MLDLSIINLAESVFCLFVCFFVTNHFLSLEATSWGILFSSATTELPSNSSLPLLMCLPLLSVCRAAFASEGCGSENHPAFIVAPLHFLFLCFNQAYCKSDFKWSWLLICSFINFGILLVFFHNLYFLVCSFFITWTVFSIFLKHGPCMNSAAKNTSLPGDVSTFASLEIWAAHGPGPVTLQSLRCLHCTTFARMSHSLMV